MRSGLAGVCAVAILLGILSSEDFPLPYDAMVEPILMAMHEDPGEDSSRSCCSMVTAEIP